jgi:hypothetical protein
MNKGPDGVLCCVGLMTIRKTLRIPLTRESTEFRQYEIPQSNFKGVSANKQLAPGNAYGGKPLSWAP